MEGRDGVQVTAVGFCVAGPQHRLVSTGCILAVSGQLGERVLRGDESEAMLMLLTDLPRVPLPCQMGLSRWVSLCVFSHLSAMACLTRGPSDRRARAQPGPVDRDAQRRGTLHPGGGRRGSPVGYQGPRGARGHAAQAEVSVPISAQRHGYSMWRHHEGFLGLMVLSSRADPLEVVTPCGMALGAGAAAP